MMQPYAPRPIPRATYRLQFNKQFGFEEAAALAPYLAALGVSHVYCSPYLRARPGSTHGYDIVSHTELNPELGSDAAFRRMVLAFRSHGLGQILDFVPNHMGVGGADNRWWLDVLEWGRDSDFAGWFDIDWDTDRRYLQDKILVPFLGGQYGAELQSGALRLKFDHAEGSLSVWAYGIHKLPISPLHYGRILGDEHPELERLGDAFAHLANWRPNVDSRASTLKTELAALARENEPISASIEAAISRFEGTPGDLEGWSRLDALIGAQHWRPAHFRVAADDINYRRFFNVNDLAGIRMELPEVFDHAHSLVFSLLEERALDGIRLDHVDGLLDPKAYCLRLRESAPRPFYLLVEKILAQHETLREDWDVEGTTGYEFANLVTGLLIDPAGEQELTRFYREFTGKSGLFADIVRDCKIRIMDNEMASELNVLAREAARVARSNPLSADFTDNVLHRALKEIVAAFPVYRTYVDARDKPTDADRRDIDWAIAQARRRDDAPDPSVFDFLHQLLTCDLTAAPRSGFSREEVARVAMRAQQLSGPVMAKGLEDTAFYRYNRFLPLNEVGGHPDQFQVSPAAFHHANLHRVRNFPHAMLATSTHDTKRGEDVRARLAALSEIPDAWTDRVPVWSKMLRARHAGSPEDRPPVRNDEYAFYQLLLGAWPPGLKINDAAALSVFCHRIEGAMLKATREAKVHTSWAAPNAAYEDGVTDFVRHALDTSRPNPFLQSFNEFKDRLAFLGVRNSLIQTVLKLTVPGVPDIYQGAELWDMNLVDPDNRRPVDYGARKALLEGVENCDVTHLVSAWEDGGIKLRLLTALLRLRVSDEQLFKTGSYEPLTAGGSQSDRVCAFLRRAGGSALLTAAALWPGRGYDGWEESTLQLPNDTHARVWTNALNGREISRRDDGFRLRDLFETLPVAVLHLREGSVLPNSDSQ